MKFKVVFVFMTNAVCREGVPTCFRFSCTIRRPSTSVANSRRDLPAFALIRLYLHSSLRSASESGEDEGDSELLRDEVVEAYIQ